MATPVQRWAAVVGALTDTDTPDPTLQLEVAEACCLALGYLPADIAAMTNGQKARLALNDFQDFGRQRLRKALEPAAETTKQTGLNASVGTKLPGV